MKSFTVKNYSLGLEQIRQILIRNSVPLNSLSFGLKSSPQAGLLGPPKMGCDMPVQPPIMILGGGGDVVANARERVSRNPIPSINHRRARPSCRVGAYVCFAYTNLVLQATAAFLFARSRSPHRHASRDPILRMVFGIPG